MTQPTPDGPESPHVPPPAAGPAAWPAPTAWPAPEAWPTAYPARPPEAMDGGFGSVPPAPPAYPPTELGAGPDADPTPAARRWMGFDPAKGPPHWGMGDVLLGLVAFIVGSMVAGVPVALLTDQAQLVSIAALAGSWVGMVGYLVLISRQKGFGSLREDFGFRFKLIDPVLGIAAGFVTLIVANVVSTAIANLFGAPPGSNEEAIFGDKANHAIIVVIAMMAAIGAPIAEELFFRGLVLRAVERRLGAIVGVIASAAVFGLLHWQGGALGSTLSLVSAIVVFGLIFAVLTRWSGRLGPAICTHMCINGLASAITLYELFSGTTLR